jgi:hypothetical protein
MTEKRIRATSRVTVTVEIDTGGSWDSNCTVEQIHRQAAIAARAALMKGLVIDLTTIGQDNKTTARLVGDPKVLAIFVEEA